MSRGAKNAPSRTASELRHHYQVEKELANQLRHASKEERGRLYSAVYNELYRRVPDHPQLTRKSSTLAVKRFVALQMRFIERFLDKGNSTFLEVGPGDCALSLEVAKVAKRVFAVDVSSSITEGLTPPSNFELILSDGSSIPVPSNSVDLAYSYQLMEHLHPDDAFEQLQNIYRALSVGGAYVCVTPNRLNGPHDISEMFDDVATGFHLREYTIFELNSLFRRVGFRTVKSYAGVKGRYIRLPMPILVLIESILGNLPRWLGKTVARTMPCRAILGIRLVGMK